jgi:hypothetical protein
VDSVSLRGIYVVDTYIIFDCIFWFICEGVHPGLLDIFASQHWNKDVYARALIKLESAGDTNVT